MQALLLAMLFFLPFSVSAQSGSANSPINTNAAVASVDDSMRRLYRAMRRLERELPVASKEAKRNAAVTVDDAAIAQAAREREAAHKKGK